MKLFVATFALLAIAIIMLGVKVLFTKNGKFPSHHAAHSAALKSKGVQCASHQSSSRS